MHPDQPTPAPDPQGGITDEQVALFVLGEADQDTRSTVAMRLPHDPALALRVRTAQSALRDMTTLASVDASMQVSAAQRARLASLMPAQRPSWLQNAASSAAEVALLLLDSLRGPAVAPGYRSVDQGEARLLRYDCLQGVVDLRLERDRVRREVSLSGQVATPTPVVRVHVLQHATGENVEVCDVAPDGYFECSLTPGHYALEFVTTQHASSVIPSLDLREEDGATG